MLNQCLVPSITKKSHFLLFGCGTATTYSPSDTKIFVKIYQKPFLFETISKVMSKKYK